MSYSVYKIREIVCEHCGQTLRKRMAAGYRFCSRLCARRFEGEKNKRRVMVDCEQCGKKTEKMILRAYSGRKLFCSRECADAFQHKRIEFACIICKKKFSVGILHTDTANTKYCSNACKWKDGQSDTKPGTSFKMREIICGGCGKKVLKRMPKGIQFCSHKCFCAHVSRCCREKRTIECAYCHKLVVKKIKIKDGQYKNRFCGSKCANAFRSEDENAKQNMREMRAKQNRRKGPNGLELAGRNLLTGLGLILGVDFEEQSLLNKRFIVDVYIKSYNVAIEWDGDYWHGHPSYKTLDATQQATKKKDHAENRYLTACGYILLRFWESDVHANPDKVKKIIRKTLKKHQRRDRG